MLRTADGGKNWTETKDTPTSDHFYFVNTKDGWIAGGKEHSFFVTHDAGDSWQPVSLPKVAGTEPNYGVDYDLPIFLDERHGFVSVGYELDPLITSVFFATEDGGRTWRQEQTFASAPDRYSLSAAGTFLIIVHTETTRSSLPVTKGAANASPTFKTKLSFRSANQMTASGGIDISFAGAPMQFSFLGSSEGWMISASGRLLTTQDKGAGWTDITPAAANATSPRGPRARPQRNALA
jgi:photosystem II stability/assembly factor-like uncharacterized protein